MAKHTNGLPGGTPSAPSPETVDGVASSHTERHRQAFGQPGHRAGPRRLRVDHPRPTKIGDVLILRSRQTFTAYVVGVVSRVGQEDFTGAGTIAVVATHHEAVSIATARAGQGGRIYLFDIGTAEWEDIPNSALHRFRIRPPSSV